MATEIAVTSGIGNIVLDVRRGDGPAGCFDYTFGALATTDRLIEKTPEIAAAALRALVAAPRDAGGPEALSAARDPAHRADRAARCALLRRRDQRDIDCRGLRLRPLAR